MAKKRPTTVAAYIRAAPPEGRPHLRKLRAILRSAAPKARETIKWGNPFFVEEVVKYLVDHGLIERHGSDWDMTVPSLDLLKIPGSVVDAISRRLARLDVLELELLKILAVFGQGIDLDTLAEVSGYDRGRLQSALLELQSRQIVTPQET